MTVTTLSKKASSLSLSVRLDREDSDFTRKRLHLDSETVASLNSPHCITISEVGNQHTIKINGKIVLSFIHTWRSFGMASFRTWWGSRPLRLCASQARIRKVPCTPTRRFLLRTPDAKAWSDLLPSWPSLTAGAIPA